jgi:hypothetical protein
MLPEGEDLNEWIAVNSKFFKTFTCRFIEFAKISFNEFSFIGIIIVYNSYL